MASDIQVYGADWCGLTYGLREFLTRGRFAYDYFDIESDPEAHAFVASLNSGHSRFPIVVIEDCVMTDPRKADLQRVLFERGVRPKQRLR